RDFSVLGVHRVIGKLAFFRKLIAQMVHLIEQRKPSLLFLVDYGAVNLRIAQIVRKSMPELSIYQFISPQIWASRPWRAKTIKENNINMLVILPFEKALLESLGIRTKFVGHPLVRNHGAPRRQKQDFCQSVGLNPAHPIIAIFSGSRKQELEYILPVSLQAICTLLETNKCIQFVISVADSSLEDTVRTCIDKSPASAALDRNLFVVPASQNHELMSHCDMAWAKSGTTTLEVALFGKPMLIYYRGSWLDYLVVSLFKTTKLVGLPNILAGQEIVPELLQQECNPGVIARMTKEILTNYSIYQSMSRKLLNLRAQLGSLDYVSECVRELFPPSEIATCCQ
ncbi:MAG: hypothetical protein JST44_27045, partial [Cyanobacteria bacterium SZAS LIN-5]|nr:hypothetical protein [Cyanobacteria bacterium SZAS LIN-5]